MRGSIVLILIGDGEEVFTSSRARCKREPLRVTRSVAPFHSLTRQGQPDRS